MGFGRFRKAGDKVNRRAGIGASQTIGSRLVEGLRARGIATSDEIAQMQRDLSLQLPVDLAAFLEEADGAEGFVAGGYLAMWRVTELVELNALVNAKEFAPDLVFFATDGGLEGYALSRKDHGFINVPMIGMGVIEPTTIGTTFAKFLEWIASRHPLRGPAPIPDKSRFGLVAHEITPIMFGGSPVDPANKALVPLKQYAELVGWWNEQVRRSTDPGSPG